jgi:hypothetical protein
MLEWLHNLPTALGALVVCAAFVVPTLVGSYLLQPYVGRIFKAERDSNTVLGFLLNAFALYFGVLLALLSIAVFENHNKANDAVVGEAAALIKLYRDLHGYSEENRSQFAKVLDTYVDEVVGPGWLYQGRGKANPREIAILTDFHRQIGAYRPTNPGESIRYAETLRALDGFVQARRLRISAGDSAIPRIMWFIVLVGAFMNVMVIWMFDLKAFSHAVIGGTISLFIGLVIYMIAVLDAPFKGTNGIRPDALIEIHAQTGMHR